MLKAGRSLSGHERNCCFLNTQGGRFADVSAAANIDFDDDGRILALTDWDQDGDEDFWIANRNGPQVRFLRNDTQNDYHFVAFKLTGTTCNRDAIGARVEVRLKDDIHPLRIRTLRAGEGYLAQSSKWLSFGLGENSNIEKVTVRWPDRSAETFTGIEVDGRYAITQGAGEANRLPPVKRRLDLSPSKITVPKSSDQSRIVLIAPVPIPSIQYEATNGGTEAILGDNGRARVVNLWASWCEPCIAELNEWGKHAEELRRAGLDVIPINVDEPESDRVNQKQTVLDLVKRLGMPFETGFGTKDLVVQFDVLQRSILRRQKNIARAE